MLVPKHVDSNMILHGACPSPEAASARGKFQLCIAAQQFSKLSCQIYFPDARTFHDLANKKRRKEDN